MGVQSPLLPIRPTPTPMTRRTDAAGSDRGAQRALHTQPVWLCSRGTDHQEKLFSSRPPSGRGCAAPPPRPRRSSTRPSSRCCRPMRRAISRPTEQVHPPPSGSVVTAGQLTKAGLSCGADQWHYGRFRRQPVFDVINFNATVRCGRRCSPEHLQPVGRIDFNRRQNPDVSSAADGRTWTEFPGSDILQRLSAIRCRRARSQLRAISIPLSHIFSNNLFDMPRPATPASTTPTHSIHLSPTTQA